MGSLEEGVTWMKPMILLCLFLSLIMLLNLFSQSILPKVVGVSEAGKPKVENPLSKKPSASADNHSGPEANNENGRSSFEKGKVTDLVIKGLPVDANIADVIVIRSEMEPDSRNQEIVTTYFDPRANRYSYLPPPEVRIRFNASLTNVIYRDPPSNNEYTYTLSEPLDAEQEALIYIQPLQFGPQHFWRSELEFASTDTLVVQYEKQSSDVKIDVPSDVRRHTEAEFFNLSLRYPSEGEKENRRLLAATSELRSSDLPMKTQSLKFEGLAYPEGSYITARFQVFFPNDNVTSVTYTYILNESGQIVDTVEKD